MKKILLILSPVILALSLAGQVLVQDGKNFAQIIIPDGSHRVEAFAAEELKEHIQKITNVSVPVTEKSKTDKKLSVKIFIGTSFAEKFPEDLKALKGNDGFTVRSKGNHIYIFGSVPKGTLNGVYSFLEENTDIIWARPQNYGTVFTPAKTLRLVKSNYRNIPVNNLRGWQITSYPYNKDTELWNIRMACNKNPTQYGRKDSYNRSLDGGMVMMPLFGHNLKLFMPKTDFQKHPEYFALCGGIRRPAGETQLCFSNMAGADHFAKNAVVLIKKMQKKFQTDMISINIEDNHANCECKNCQQDIVLPDGKVLSKKAPNFLSTRYYIYLNRIAEKLKKEFPSLRIMTYAYFFTAEPPAVKIADNIDIAFCPAVKDDKQNILHLKNRIWKQRIDEFAKRSANMVWREYYGCASTFPRPLAERAAEDMRYLAGIGVKKIYTEGPPDLFMKEDPAKKQRNYDGKASWDVSAMDFWVLTKLYWDPYQDVEKLRDKYISRTYQAAKKEMKEYYALIRNAWYSDELPSTLSDNAYRNAIYYISNKNIEEKCHSLLKKALKKANQANVKKLVADHLERFENWMKNKELYAQAELRVPCVDTAGKNLTADSPLWDKGALISEFKVMNRPAVASKYPTKVKVMHDGKALHILFICTDDRIKNLYSPANLRGTEVFPDGDHVELFLDSGKAKELYCHFAVNFRNEKYDAKGYNGKWNTSWKSQAKIMENEYRILFSIPFASLGFKEKAPKELKGMFCRMFHHDKKDGKKESSSWGAMVVHQPAGFGNIILEK